MRPRIAIAVPHSERREYNERALPQYVHAVEAEGAEAVPVPADASPTEIASILNSCQGVLLPGSPADVDPQKYGAAKDPHTNPADPGRDNVDELLLQDAHNMYKPVLGICYGLQALNVWRTGTLLQHIQSPVNHEAGKMVPIAHEVKVEPDSELARILGDAFRQERLEIPVNSSHHQSADVAGDGLRVVARCPEDGVIEALEGTNPQHFVLGIQWHPERSYDQDATSKAIFHAFVDAAKHWHPREVSESVLDPSAPKRGLLGTPALPTKK
jgi:putative glutamine amidotransferase